MIQFKRRQREAKWELFDSLDAVLSDDFVAGCRQPNYIGPDESGKPSEFHQFSISRAEMGPRYLMAEYDGGARWWVMGEFGPPVPTGLPDWPRYVTELDEGKSSK